MIVHDNPCRWCGRWGAGLWELRSTIRDGIARVFFTIWSNHVVVLRAFAKESQKTPINELKTAQRRLADFRRNNP